MSSPKDQCVCGHSFADHDPKENPAICKLCAECTGWDNGDMAGRLEEVPRDVLIREQGHKDDYEKVNFFCLPWEAVNEMAEVMTFGAKKYEAFNFRKGMKASRLFSAIIRHLYAWHRGEELDPESNKSHLAHAACCVLMLRDIEILDKVEDDRWGNANRTHSAHSGTGQDTSNRIPSSPNAPPG